MIGAGNGRLMPLVLWHLSLECPHGSASPVSTDAADRALRQMIGTAGQLPYAYVGRVITGRLRASHHGPLPTREIPTD